MNYNNSFSVVGGVHMHQADFVQCHELLVKEMK